MNASDVMVRDVVRVEPEEPVSKAVQLLVDHDISALPVVDSDRRVIGILSEADLLHRERIGTEKHRAWWIEAVTPPSVLALDYAKSQDAGWRRSCPKTLSRPMRIPLSPNSRIFWRNTGSSGSRSSPLL